TSSSPSSSWRSAWPVPAVTRSITCSASVCRGRTPCSSRCWGRQWWPPSSCSVSSERERAGLPWREPGPGGDGELGEAERVEDGGEQARQERAVGRRPERLFVVVAAVPVVAL